MPSVENPEQRIKVLNHYDHLVKQGHEFGFVDEDAYASIGSPFSVFMWGLFLYPAAYRRRDLVGMHKPFRMTIFYVLMRHHHLGTFITLAHSNPTFSTLFLDGTVVETVAAPTKVLTFPDARVYRFGLPDERGLIKRENRHKAIAMGWELHQEKLKMFQDRGLILNRNLSDEIYHYILATVQYVIDHGNRGEE
ncbi:MAG: hypothetical protein AAFR81_21720 [Chloroflexota bacterium]